MIDPRDAALRHTCPTLSAPRFGALPEMRNGQRVIVAANGLFLQIKLDWLDAIVRLADIAPMPPLPYGVLTECIRFSFGVIPVLLLEAFIDAGRAGLPNEVAGGLIYSRRTGGLRLQIYDVLHCSPNGIDYLMPSLDDDESIAIDLHTHGYDRAFWSSTDNRDDQGVKVAGVFGNLHRKTPSAAFRLAINGYYQALRHPWDTVPVGREAGPQDDSELDPGSVRSILRWLGFN